MHGTGSGLFSRRFLTQAGICLVVLCVMPSCMRAIGTPGQRSTSGISTVGASTATRSTGASADSDALRVGGEFIRPVDVWRFERSRLTESSHAMDAVSLRQFVEQEAARLVRDAVTERLLYQEATERLAPQVEKNVESYIDAEIRRIVTEGFGGVQRRYERDLKSQGVSIDEVREKMRREVIIASYVEAQVKPKIVEPSRGDLMMAYEAYRKENDRPERRSMSLIDVRVVNRLPDDVIDPNEAELSEAQDKARERIESARKELEGGASFADVAQRYSDGLHAFEGGAWGWVRPESVRARFAPAVERLYTLEEGAVSEPIQYDGGFYLVRCDEIEGGGTPDFVSLQPELKERFSRNMFNALVSDLVEELRAKAHLNQRDLDQFWQATVREGMRIVQESSEGPPSP